MRLLVAPLTMATALCLGLTTGVALADPEQTVRSADTTLREIMAINNSIPQSLLARAEGVAIIPDVIKVGFIAGLRRGHGVVVVRGPERNWSLPQFITLTGGSVGWQAGVSGTDVVLVFMTKKSIEGLLGGKFTIGADAAVAAGPVGRNAAAATDFRLKAEILSYSRSRGLFVGIALDGSAIEIDANEYAAYYGNLQPRVPESATKLLADLEAYVQNVPPQAGAIQAPMPGAVAMPELTVPTQAGSKAALAASATRLYAVVDDGWQKYLALPGEVFKPGDPPPLSSLETALRQYQRVLQEPQYQSLAQRGEFLATYDQLQLYTRELSENQSPHLALPPPPPKR